jgi:hypothetical protein
MLERIIRRILVSSLIVPLLLAGPLSAKGATTRITIRDTTLSTSIDIIDPSILESFNIWTGPGTYVGGREGTEGFIVDWSSGIIAARPPGLRQYEVLFYVSPVHAADEQPAYVVLYEHDPSSGRGFVYLPGKSDERYKLNTRSILRGHGFEGSWFRATTAWQHVVAKLISVR